MDPNEAVRRLTEMGEPSDERGYVTYIEGLLKEAGVPTALIRGDGPRPCLYAKIAGSGGHSPLLLYGRVGLEQSEGGPVGLSGGAALFVTTMLKIKAMKIRLSYDLLLLLVTCDEDGGLRLVTENYPKLFYGVKYAINDTGGFPVMFEDKKMHPIIVTERQAARFRVTARGAMALSRIIQAAARLEKKPLPVRLTEPVKRMASEFGKALGETDELLFRFMQRPFLTRKVASVMGANKKPLFESLLANEAKIIAVKAINEQNADAPPESAYFDVEARLLPNISIKEGMADIRGVIGAGYEIEALRGFDGRPVDMALYDAMAETLIERDHTSLPVPFVSRDITEARYLARLGVQTYGFAPIDALGTYSYFEIPKAGGQTSPDALTSGAQTLLEFLSKRE